MFIRIPNEKRFQNILWIIIFFLSLCSKTIYNMENDLSMAQFIKVLIPGIKKESYRDLFLTLMVKSPDSELYRKHAIKRIMKIHPSVSRVELNKLNFVQLTIFENYISTFFNSEDIQLFINSMKKMNVDTMKRKFKDYPKKKFKDCLL